MKTKQIAPWKLKVGQKLLQSGGRFNTIKSIVKSTGVFTGKAVWTVTTDALLFEAETKFHAKLNLLPYQKATILVK